MPESETRGVSLTKQEWNRITGHAGELGEGVTTHAVAQWLLRWALGQLEQGEIEIPTKRKMDLVDPD